MKKAILFTTVLTSATLAYAQPGSKPGTKTPAKPVSTKPAPPPSSLKNLKDSANYALGLSFANFCKQQGNNNINTNLVMKAIDDVFGANKNDSASYALGMSFANFYKEQGITSVNKDLIKKGLSDGMSGKQVLNEGSANMVLNNYLGNIQSQKSQPNIAAGVAFLEKNKANPNVKTTATGLQYEVVVQGTGEKPRDIDSVTCHYKGTLLSGVEFDNSYNRGQPITFALNRVIKGWTEGLQLMSVGSKYKFYIPYELGYGAYDYGPIPGGSMLTFEVELLDVRKAQ